MAYDLTIPTTIAGLISAGLWFYSSTGVTREEMFKRRTRRAERAGTTPDLSGMSIDGIDLGETIRHQTRANRAAALASGITMLLQAIDHWV